MFYSQFILAKKGPLGTIWIAAHLERKLRKNQVADTDIGVSVDSILFPDVPIALRLSSHLLLGVVRIYSRKVNYLFDDCSEALLKIKQAFRSTAVDLPPEESTAPYHSITLPETFDLDDFELPDEMFQGNYVDHHISTNEQITLQDTMDGVVYSTSQFGLDERFGEGDASQIGLDIDEDLFLSKVATEVNDDGFPNADPMASASPMTLGEKDENYEGVPGTSAMMLDNGNDDLIEIPASSREAFDHFTPFTPGMECATPLNIEETMACNSPMEVEDRYVAESEAAECATDANKQSDTQEMVPLFEENGFVSGDAAMEQGESRGHSETVAVATENISADNGLPTPSSILVEHAEPIPQLPECSNGHISAEDGPNRVKDVHNGVVVNNEPSGHLVDRTDGQFAESPSCSQVTTELEDPGRRTCSAEGEVQNNMGESCSTSNALASNVCLHESPDRPEVVNDSTHEHVPSKEFPVLRACNSLIQPDLSSPIGEVKQSIDAVEIVLEKKLDEEMDKAATCDTNDRSAASDLPEPEKLLSVPDELKQNDLLMVSTPEKEVFGDNEGDMGAEQISGKKRSFTESTLTVHSLNSGESFSMNKSRRTAESIPGDDDLLSSILVGRRSSVLKLKPTPPALEIVSTKRQRSAPRASALKRKVLMDDMMVLHGDTIRQQLTNTEDIRRLRKKAPCTRREIAMIQRQFLEEEIFSEPIFTGMSAALASLHREAFELDGIKVTENEEIVLIELEKDVDSVVRSDEGTKPDDICIEKENTVVENSDLRPQQETPAELAHMEMDGQNIEITNVSELTVHEQNIEVSSVAELSAHEQNIEVANVAELLVHDLESLLPIDSVANDFANAPENVLQQDVDTNNDASASLQLDLSSLSPQKCDTEVVDDIALAGTSKGVDTVEVNENDAEVGVDLENHNGNHGDGNLAVDEIGNISLSVADPNVAQPSDFGCDEKGLSSICMPGEGTTVNPSFAVELDGNGENLLFDKEEHADFQEQADLASAMNPDLEFRGEFDDVMAGNDTEFLNVDDDEVAEDDEDYAPGAEDTRLHENSGWSTRTRAVSKYLQTLFEKEPQNGKRVLGMDNLLMGKTRKEASRMFFETLVLKTKDYIHVEQANPFDNINVKPRIKLMKSDF